MTESLAGLRRVCATGILAAVVARAASASPAISPQGPAPRCVSANIPAGGYAAMTVAQDTADVAIEIRSPAGVTIARIDAFEHGTERASVVAPSGGAYRFCAVPDDRSRSPVRFPVNIEGPRKATSEDAVRIGAEALSTEARSIGRKQDGASIRSALEKLRQATKLWHDLADDEAEVRSLIAQGDAFSALSDYPHAVEQYDRALGLNGGQWPRSEGEALANSGVAKLRLGDIDGALRAYDGSLEIFSRLNQPFLVATVENNRANLFRQTGEFQKALDSYLRALPVLRQTGRHSEAVVMGNIGLAYSSLAEYDKAESWIARSLPLLPESADRIARGVALSNLGRVRSLAGNADGAVTALRQSVALTEGAANRRARADALNNLGQVFYRKGEFREAEGPLNDAADLYRDIHDVRGLASADYYEGAAMARLGRANDGIGRLRESFDLRNDARLDDDALTSLVEIARAERLTSDTQAALADLERAANMAEKLRLNVASPDLRATWWASRKATYESLLDLLFDSQSGDNPQAFAARTLEISERARARSWMDELGGKRYEALRNLKPEIAEDEQRITRDLTYKTQQLAQMGNTPEAAPKRVALSREVDDLELRYDSLQSEIAARGRFGSQTSATLTADDVMRLVDDHTVLVEFMVGAEHSYGWVATSREIRWFRLPSEGEIGKLAGPAVSLAGARRERLRNPSSEAAYRNAMRSLGQTLFGPVASLIGDKTLVVSADGILNSVPFAALPSPIRPFVPLGITNDMAAIPSASMLAALRSRAPAGEHEVDLAVFADPVFAGDPRAAKPKNPPTAVSLARLPFSLREANFIGQAASGLRIEMRLGFSASLAVLKEEDVRRAGIVHFATHANVNDRNPELSGIFLSQLDRTGRQVEGFLSLPEIYDLNLPAELVVLSGCSTGLGKAVDGDGFIGLTKAFFYAGSSRVVSSLWAVDDEGTALFMKAFYANLLRSVPNSPAHALRAARTAMWNDARWRDPAYWSGFVLEGEWKPIGNEGASY